VKRQLARILLVHILTISTVTAGVYSGGTGDPNTPFLIGTAQDILEMSDIPDDWDKHFLMIADVNMLGYTFEQAVIAPIIGTETDVVFTGTFEGDNHKIAALIIDTQGQSTHYLGLFGSIKGNASIRNLGLIDVEITGGPGSFYLGAVVGMNDGGMISNCYSNGTMHLGGRIGGLCGFNIKGVIRNSSSQVSVFGTEDFVGGLIGINSGGDVTCCYSSGYVEGSRSCVGGLIGFIYDDTMIESCNSVSIVKGHKNYIGGLIGLCDGGVVSKCYATGTVLGEDYSDDLGGLIGYLNGLYQPVALIKESFATGPVVGPSSASVGGLIGTNDRGNVEHCYATGNVSGGSVGGLICRNEWGYVKYCYAVGYLNPTATKPYAGGLTFSNEGFCIQCFWNVETSGMDTSEGGTGLTTEQMTSLHIFRFWGRSDLWVIEEGQDYPHLAWEGTSGTTITYEPYSGGSGIQDAPYEISQAEDLLAMSAYPEDWDKHFVMTSDINMSGYTFTQAVIAPNGATDNVVYVGAPFTGRFNGKGHIIRYLLVDTLGLYTDNLGLFGRLEGAFVENLSLLDVRIVGGTGSVFCGGLAGYCSESTLIHCDTTGDVTGCISIGGLLGQTDGSSNRIYCCYSSCSVNGTKANIGGLIGELQGGLLTCSYATGTVILTGNSNSINAGGLLGSLNGYYGECEVRYCYAAGSVSGFRYTGGLIGYNNQGKIVSCYSAGPVSVGIGSEYWGGLVGWTNRLPQSCYWDIEASGQSTSAGGDGKTTEQMKQLDTFLFWGRYQQWVINDGKEYPHLVWEETPGALIEYALYSGGSGTEDDPYLIGSVRDLMAMRSFPEDWDKFFEMTADIDLSGYTFERALIAPDENDSDEGFQGTWFSGVFDANDCVITNLTIITGGKNIDYLGLFGGLCGSKVLDMGLENVVISGSDGSRCIGGLAGAYTINCNDCGIFNSYANVNISSGRWSDSIGCLVGYNEGNIAGCCSAGSISCADYSKYIGGLTGANISNKVHHSYFTGSITVVGSSEHIGGLIGKNSGDIAFCFTVSTITAGTGLRILGGLVGSTEYTVRCSYWNTDISGLLTSAGGEGKTTEQMMQLDTFKRWGREGNYWRIDEGNDYPHLFWEGTTGRVITYEPYFDGAGTQEDPYLIASSDDLLDVSVYLEDWDKHFVMIDNIDLSSYSFERAVIAPDWSNAYPDWFDGPEFSGTWNGQDYTIRDLTIQTSTTREYLGLFGVLNAKSYIHNLHMENVYISGQGSSKYIGGLAGYNSGEISRCSTWGKLIGGAYSSRLGGIVGENTGQLIDCHTNIDIIVGTTSFQIGGLVGSDGGGEFLCSAVGSIGAGKDSDDIGGLIGRCGNSTISNCWSSVNVSVSGIESLNVGGLLGYGEGCGINHCYATGVASRSQSNWGGLAGCYRYGRIKNSFWDTDVYSRIRISPPKSIGASVTYPGQLPYEAYGKPTVELWAIDTYTSHGWDFVGERDNGQEDVWTICDGMNYPRFSWQIHPYDKLCPDGVGIEDLLFMTSFWMEHRLHPYVGPDLTGDGWVTLEDFSLLAENWLEY
jgi:hypothetical protein